MFANKKISPMKKLEIIFFLKKLELKCTKRIKTKCTYDISILQIF